MNKVIKRILICVLTASVLVILVLLSKLNSRLPDNPPSYFGNTSGNLQNHGLFVEDENFIYFADVSNSFRICKMDKNLENAEQLTQDSGEYLKLDSEQKNLYYSRINYRMNTLGSSVYDISNSGVYRLQLKHNRLTRLYENTCGSVFLLGNQLYFQKHGEDGNFDLCSVSVSKEKQKPQLVTTDPIQPVCSYGEALYFTGVQKDHYLYSLSSDSKEQSVYARLDCYLPIAGADGFYFLSQAHNYALYYLPFNSDKASEIVGYRLSSYNISPDGETIYYQVDNQKNNRLCRYDAGRHIETTLINGDFRNLNAVSHYLFFTDFEEKVCYCYDRDTDTVTTFLPDVKLLK